jgi:hypothetical protein
MNLISDYKILKYLSSSSCLLLGVPAGFNFKTLSSRHPEVDLWISAGRKNVKNFFIYFRKFSTSPTRKRHPRIDFMDRRRTDKHNLPKNMFSSSYLLTGSHLSIARLLVSQAKIWGRCYDHNLLRFLPIFC